MDHLTPTVSIIVVSFNTRKMTLDCLRSVAEQTTISNEVIVLDNHSHDGSADAIAEEFPEIRLIAETENLGFARANNVAAKYARGKYILLLNPDTVVLDGAIDKLVSFARSIPTAKIWGGRTVYGDGSLNDTCCFQRMTLWTAFCRATGIAGLFNNHRFVSTAYGGWQMNDSRSVDIITGCFMLIERGLWDQLGGFDLTFFMYGEEADLCVRATRDFGARPHFTPDAQIVHHGGASETLRTEKMVRLLKAADHLCQQSFCSVAAADRKVLLRNGSN